ncbi:MAG: hypothetical protein WCG01_02770 [bacterium]
MRIFTKFFFFSLALWWLVNSHPVLAQGVTISPVIVDEISVARGLVEKSINIQNNTTTKVTLYPFVNEVTQSGGKQVFDAYAADKTTSLANWIDFSRKTIELMPGASTSVPLRIQVHPSAKAGKYYAIISIINGANRPDAESRISSSIDSGVTINLEIKDNKIENAELGDFNVLNFFNFNNNVDLTFNIKNAGNQLIVPTGNILIYDNRGREIDEIKVNTEGKNIIAGEKQFNKLIWATGNKMGKFKAKLSLKYGDVTKRDLQDSVYFWVLPKWFLGLVGFIVLILFVSIMILVMRLGRLKKSLYEDERGEIINLRGR